MDKYVIAICLSYLEPNEINQLQLVNKLFNQAANIDFIIWKPLLIRHFYVSLILYLTDVLKN